MGACTFHKHSSAETAAKCYGDRVGKRGDLRMKMAGVLYARRYRSVRHDPPLVVPGPVPVTYFFGAIGEYA